jgi:hypothetical protein
LSRFPAPRLQRSTQLAFARAMVFTRVERPRNNEPDLCNEHS